MPPLLALLVALATPSSVTFERGATALPTLLKELGAEVGVDLKADPRLRELRVTVRFDETEPERALALIAEALEAEWVVDGAGRLIRPRPGLEAEKRRELERRVQGAIAKLNEGVAPIEPWTAADAERVVRESKADEEMAETMENWEARHRRRRQSPSGRLMRRVIASLPIADLAQATGATRTVYTENPTRLQRRLPPAALQAIRDYRTERKMEEAARSRLYPEVNAPLLTEAPPSPAHVIVEGNFGAVTVRVVIPDAREHGWTLQESIPLMWFEPDPEVAKELPEPEGDFEPSEVGRLVLKALQTFRLDPSAGAPEPMTDAETAAYSALFTDLVKNEPLSWIVSDVFLQSARALDRDLVAVLPDFSFFLAMTPGPHFRGSLRDAVASMMRSGGLALKDSNGAMVVVGGAAAPSQAFWSFSREAASRYVRAQTGRPPSLEAEADLALGCKTIETYMATSMFTRLAFPGWNPSLSRGDNTWRALRLYGHLAANERRAAEAGGYRRPVSQCPPAVRQELVEMLYSPNVQLTSGSHESEGEYRIPVDVREGEPTTRYPNGIPMDAVLEIVVIREPRVFIRTEYPGGFSNSAPTTVRQLASQVFWESRDSGNFRVTRSFAMSTLERLDVTLTLEEGVTVFSRHDMPPALGPKEYGSLENLPADVVAEFRQKLQEVEERYKGAQFGQPRTSRP